MDDRSLFTDAPAVPALDETEAAVVRLWEEALQVRPLGRDDNFFEMGGTSMLAVRICGGVERLLGFRPTADQVFDTDTLAEFAALVRAAAPVAAPALVRAA
ncbi:phosphopantetheine-binding protein [Streptomyces antimicrobicus]|uniref:Phosphopantetheine-binding protein n=1 Tax=Streptomyces antimicrobicus TaxID=2883108 RepID=A0ABS8B1B3_9ACTN|nr:phosphopantetheine-binding protein [Streptomyces antimicrobicus]MCB5178386.1 phosphopantetheine-binding protein [Streptomyces antimicrobicus]